MKILRLLNKTNLSILIIFFFLQNSYSTEPVDIWKVEKKSNENKAIDVEKIQNQDQPSELIIKTIIEKKNTSEINETENLFSENINIIGIYDPEENNLSMDMWVNSNGKIILIDQKDKLIKKLGKKKLIIHLESKINKIPNSLMKYKIEIDDSKNKLTFLYDKINNNTSITTLLQKIREENIVITDINTEESSLEEIFVNIVKGSNDEYSRY